MPMKRSKLTKKFIVSGICAVILGSCFPSLACSTTLKEELKESSSHATRSPSPAFWEPFIKNETKEKIKKESEFLIKILERNNINETRNFIYYVLKQREEVKNFFRPDAYSSSLIDNGPKALKVSIPLKSNSEQKTFNLEELPEDKLRFLAMRALWNFQNTLLDKDILEARKVTLEALSSLPLKTCNCGVDHQAFILLSQGILYRHENYWIKKEVEALRLKYFHNHPELQEALLEKKDIYVDLNYQVRLSKSWKANTLYDLKKMSRKTPVFAQMGGGDIPRRRSLIINIFPEFSDLPRMHINLRHTFIEFLAI